MATNNSVNVSLSGQTGTGTFVGATSPTLVTPALGAATATSINFGGSTLSNYVAATSWTPTFTFTGTGDLSVSYSTQTGTYTRIGNVVYFSFNVVCTPTYTTSSGSAAIAGLPIISTAATQPLGDLAFSGVWNSTALYINAAIVSSNVYMTFLQMNSGANYSNMGISNFTTGNAVTIRGSGFYYV